MRLHGCDQRFRQAFHFFLQAHADVPGFARQDQLAILVGDLVGEVKPDPLGGGHPDFGCQDLIVAGQHLVMEVRFDDWKHESRVLPGQQGVAQAAKEFPAGGFQDAEVVGVINMITNGAVGVGYAMAMDKTAGAHGMQRRAGDRGSSIWNSAEKPIASGIGQPMLGL